MLHALFANIFFFPLYNALVLTLNALPGQNAGLAIILLTILIRLVLFPLSRQAIKTQIQMKQIEPELKRIRETVKDRQEQARLTLELYKSKDINPFASIFLLFIQLPILIAIYQVFRSGLPTINKSFLYSFIHVPAMVGMTFLGISLLKGSFILALLSALTQFIQFQLAMPTPAKSDTKSFQNDLAQSMNIQMKFIFPIMIFFISYVSAVVALYFIASNLFMIAQELFVRRRLAAKLG